MQFFIVLAALVVAAFAAPHGIQVEAGQDAGEAAFAAAVAAGVDKAFIEEVKKVLVDPSTTIKQKKADIQALVDKQPAEQQAKIKELEQTFECQQKSILDEIKKQVDTLSGEAKDVAQKILDCIQDESLSPADIKTKIEQLYGSASEATQKTLKDFGEEMKGNMQEAAVKAAAAVPPSR